MPRPSPESGTNRSSLVRALGASSVARIALAGRLGAERGWPVFLVGGVVRDVLLGRTTRDLDLVVVGDAIALARLLAEREGGVAREHPGFLTASIESTRRARIDLATARRETYPRPAALPVPEPSDLEHDLVRRDFSINAIALDLSPTSFGRLVDPLGGRDDLRRRRLRALHEGSFDDDPTRAFRGIRLAVRLGFTLEPGTRRAIRHAIDAGSFDGLSATRLRRELELLFSEPGWLVIGRRVARLGLWRTIDPSLDPSEADLRRLARLERLVGPGSSLPDEGLAPGWVAVLADLARDLPESRRERIVTRLRPARDEARDLLCASDEARRILTRLRATSKRSASAVHRACRGASPLALTLAWLDTRSVRVRSALIDRLRGGLDVRADIRGSDLLRAGIPAGPAIARGLEAALAAKLDGVAPHRDDQLAVAIRAARRRRA